MKKSLFRALLILAGIIFSVVFLPAWTGNVASIGAALHSNEFVAVPLRFLSRFAIAVLFPIGFIGLFASLLPVKLIRFNLWCGIAALVVCTAELIIPWRWKDCSVQDEAINASWVRANNEADSGNPNECFVELNNRLVWYVKGPGGSHSSFFILIVYAIPCGLHGGELAMRKSKKLSLSSEQG